MHERVIRHECLYKENIDQFEMYRKFLNEVFGLNQTLKMHVIKYHYVTYFKMMGQTLREVSDKYHEGVHNFYFLLLWLSELQIAALSKASMQDIVLYSV